MLSGNEDISLLLHLQQCPFNYQCLANDCMECAELQQTGSCEDDT